MDINALLITAGMRILIFFIISVVIQIIIHVIKKRADNSKKKGVFYYIIDALGLYPFIWINGISIYTSYSLIKIPFPDVPVGDKRKIIIIFAILTVSYILIRIITNYLTHSPKFMKGKVQSTGVFVNSIKIITLIIVGLIVLNVLEIPITPIITALGVGSALLALTLQETVTNFLSGFYMASSLQFKPGDYISVKDTQIEGTVADITWRYTIIKDLQNSYNTVPNSILAKSTIINYSQPNNEYYFALPIKLSFNNNTEKVASIMDDVVGYVVENYQFCPKDYVPPAKIRNVGFNYVEYSVWFKVIGYTNQYGLKDLYYKTLLVELAKNNIEVPKIEYSINKG